MEWRGSGHGRRGFGSEGGRPEVGEGGAGGVIENDRDSGTGQVGWVTVVGGWHENVMIDGVTRDNGVGSGRREQGSVELEAKGRLGLRFSRS